MALLNWRFGFTQTTLWRIEVAPFPRSSNVATPHRTYHHHPPSTYGYGNGDDAKEGAHEGCAMGGRIGSTSETKPVAVAVPLSL